MEPELRDRYSPLLQRYELRPEHLEEYGSVIKIYTSQGPYALKRLKPKRLERSNLMQHLQILSEKGFTNFAPIYHTSDGQHILSDEENRYYLMPWLDSLDAKGDEGDQYHKMFQTLGQLHQKTLREEEIHEDLVQHHYDTLTAHWEQEQHMLEQFVVECENRWYMSPFELQYCTFHHHISKAQEFANKRLEEWQEMMKEKEKTRISLIHGNVSVNHFLFDHQRNGYFISLENSQFSTPVQDIVQFYNRSFDTYPIARNDRYEWYQIYQRSFPFTAEEKKLMLAYLAYPQRFTNQVLRYRQKREARSEHDELQLAAKLQQVHWQVSNVEYFLTQIQAAEYQAQQQQQS
ncbi:spore coat protein YsxE [Ectobacillus ponti]|uniref:Spore coat protein YsxE n=1 Tax=Ectobacillus ponti TaxID=2961894 RepID=A0AA42BMX3_9BACI|nr:spore coat protein YsxE [Ectobacillus ponti]MCP8967330.1 spore coat protein YsxE [Ectobacillus ponti]